MQLIDFLSLKNEANVKSPVISQSTYFLDKL